MVDSLKPPFDLLPPLISGLGVTLALTAGASVIAGVVALISGVARFARNPWVRGASRVYGDIFRGTSALVQLFWVYFALPMLGIRFEAMAAGILVLGLNTGAYGAEIVRGAIQAVPREQHEAAAALGFTKWQAMRRIILPQAILPMLPPFGNLWIELLKGTSLASMITLSELTFRAQTLRVATLRTGEIFGLVLILYFLVSMMISFGVRRLERRLSIGRDYGGVRAR
jgi:polar amino acid transport system permease protein